MKGVKQTSLILGSLSQCALLTNKLEYASAFKSLTAACAVVGGTAHFYTMELDYKWVLQVRPYAYLPFPLCALATYATLNSYIAGGPM